MKMAHSFIMITLLFNAICLASEQRGIQVSASNPSESSYLGCYFAYIVGINAYSEGWTPLQTAVKDSQELRDTLIKKYDFEPERVLLRVDEQATQYNIINDLKQLVSILKEHDNLLIYYAGHGQVDEFLGDGYWIPFDAKPKNPGTWVSHSSIRNILSSEMLKAKNIALISDSCYSGALLRSGPSPFPLTDQDYKHKIVGLSSLRSRQVFTSGGVEPVADGGRDGHSLFAYYFLRALKDNRMDFIDLENLFYTYVWKPVAEIGDQRPYVGRLKTLMDENGQFVLLSRSEKDKVKDFFYQSAINKQKFDIMKQAKDKIAVFPFFVEIRKGGLSVPQVEKEIISNLESYLKNNKLLNLKHSFYEFDDYRKEDLLFKIVSDEVRNNLWKNTDFFSSYKSPNLGIFCEIGNKLNVDAILTYSFYTETNRLYLAAYLIDVNKKIILQKINEEVSAISGGSEMSFLRLSFNGITSSVIKQYLGN